MSQIAEVRKTESHILLHGLLALIALCGIYLLAGCASLPIQREAIEHLDGQSSRAPRYILDHIGQIGYECRHFRFVFGFQNERPDLVRAFWTMPKTDPEKKENRRTDWIALKSMPNLGGLPYSYEVSIPLWALPEESFHFYVDAMDLDGYRQGFNLFEVRGKTVLWSNSTQELDDDIEVRHPEFCPPPPFVKMVMPTSEDRESPRKDGIGRGTGLIFAPPGSCQDSRSCEREKEVYHK